LWIDDSPGWTTWRIDPESGLITKTIKGNLVGDWGGYVWISQRIGIQGFDPASGAKGPSRPDGAGQVYACGAPLMVESARRDFTSQCGLAEDEFFADAFTPATPAAG
jgi:NAD(P)H-flavin reductase